MPSTFTSSLKLTLPATGENVDTWGSVVNSGITSLIDDAVAGTAAITLAGTDYTLTDVDGATNEARKMFIVATGTPGAVRNVICPAVSKLYFVRNNTTGGFALTFKTAGGSGISVANGTYKALYCDGTNVQEALTIAGGGGSGTVTSVGLTMPTGFTVGSSPITTSGTIGVTTTLSGVLKGTGSGFAVATAGTDYVTPGGVETLSNKTLTNPTMGNSNITNIKTASFNSQLVLASTSGTINVNWTAGQNYKQTEPTGTITYTFTPPVGPCHLQIYIESLTQPPQTFNWPASVIFFGTTWTAVLNKRAIINFWYDGTQYLAMGVNQV